MASIIFLPFSCLLFLASFMLPNELSAHDTNPSPFGFLKAMQGCRKGETSKGVRDLKHYLAHFGYLNYQQNVNTKLEDHFDDELEAALKSYQVFYHLNATGTLDGTTVAQMAMPRCGFPDKHIITPHNTNNSLHTVSHYSFFPRRQKWPTGKRKLTYGFGPLFPTRFMPPVNRAFGRWATASRYFQFSRAGSLQGADIKITFQRENHGDGSSFDRAGGILAHAFAPTDGRLHFDADERWSIGAVPNAHDIETVALHEIGHLLGLSHSQVKNAIMYPSISAGVTKALKTDDLQGLRVLYGY